MVEIKIKRKRYYARSRRRLCGHRVNTVDTQQENFSTRTCTMIQNRRILIK